MSHLSTAARSGQSFFDLNVSSSQHAEASASGVARRDSCRTCAACADERPATSPGLSTPHISPLLPPRVSGTATFYLGGSLFKVSKPKFAKGRHLIPDKAAGRSMGGQRGRITSYSHASHRRLQQMLGKVDQTAIPLFLTLTYPGEWWPESPAAWKRHFDMLDKRMERRFPGSGLMWKLEPQRRGAPHFHMCLWGVTYSEVRAWLPEAWNEVLYASKITPALRAAVELYITIRRRAGNEAAGRAVEASGVALGRVHHLLAGTGVEIVHTWRGVKRYAAKYMGKLIEGSEWEYPGRWWGCRRPENIPWAEALTLEVSHKEAAKLMRYMRRYAHIKGRDYPSLSILTNQASYWYERLDRLLE